MKVKIKHFFGERPLLFGKLFVFLVVVQSFFRGLFYFLFLPQETTPAWHDIRHALWLGLRFDVRVALCICLPLFIFGYYRANPFHSARAMNLWRLFYTVILGFCFLVFIGDIGYYAYLLSRINATIFQFAINPLISLQMVHQTYNLLIWVPVLALSLFLIHLSLKKFIFYFPNQQEPKDPPFLLNKGHKAARVFLLSSFILIGIHSSTNQYPLRWSEAFFSQDTFVSALGLNPIQYLVDTLENPKIDYSAEETRKHYDAVADFLGVIDKDAEKLNFKRPVESLPEQQLDMTGFFKNGKLVRPNIVYIVMESFAAYKTGAFGNLGNPSPYFDEIAKGGWLFRHFYTPTEGTARSMFCSLSGVPDINAKSTSSRNPLVIDQNTLINSFKSYEKFYLIGGSATWGNIRGIYQNNIQNLKIFEEGSFQIPNTDVWGLSDLHLFRESVRILTEQKKTEPFYAVIQSASFHRPYTIPKDHGDFQLLDKVSDEDLTKFGFKSLEELNSFRFSDYSLGEFFRLARKEKWFENTIFVIHGDHGLPNNGAQNIGKGYAFYNLNRFHVPLVFYSEQFAKPQEFQDMMYQPDVLPTLLGITNTQGITAALGRNYFAKNKGERFAFSYVYYSDPLQLFLYDHDYLAFGYPDHMKGLFKYSSDEPEKDLQAIEPERFAKMQNLLHGIYETSKYQLYHNPKLKDENP